MPSSEPRIVLTAIHASFLAGILLFLAITLFIAPDPGSSPAAFRWVWLIVTAGAVFGAGFVRGRLSRNAPPDRIRVAAILIWAMAEGSAMFGIVSMWVTGAPAPALGATFVAVFLLILHRPATLS